MENKFKQNYKAFTSNKINSFNIITTNTNKFLKISHFKLSLPAKKSQIFTFVNATEIFKY